MSSFRRTAARKLASAIRRNQPELILVAGAIVSGLLGDESTAVAARHVTAILESVLLATTEFASELQQGALEHAVVMLARSSTDDVPLDRIRLQLEDTWRDLASESTRGGAVDETIARTVESYLASHPAKQSRLADLALALGQSTRFVSDQVRAVTGRRFTDLRRAKVLERAAECLLRGDSVQTAAEVAGYRNPTYFSRVFRQHFGVPPSRWRATAETAPEPDRAREER